jgi:hypothetical protein
MRPAPSARLREIKPLHKATQLSLTCCHFACSTLKTKTEGELTILRVCLSLIFEDASCYKTVFNKGLCVRVGEYKRGYVHVKDTKIHTDFVLD